MSCLFTIFFGFFAPCSFSGYIERKNISQRTKDSPCPTGATSWTWRVFREVFFSRWRNAPARKRGGTKTKEEQAFKCQICFAFNMPIIVKAFQMVPDGERAMKKKGSDVDGWLWNKQISCINKTIFKGKKNERRRQRQINKFKHQLWRMMDLSDGIDGGVTSRELFLGTRQFSH